MDSKTVKIFDIIMTTDAFSILSSGFLLISVLIMTYGFKSMFLLLALSYIALAYRVNCMIVGSCYLYASIISVLTMVTVIYVIIDKNNLNALKNNITGYKKID